MSLTGRGPNTCLLLSASSLVVLFACLAQVERVGNGESDAGSGSESGPQDGSSRPARRDGGSVSAPGDSGLGPTLRDSGSGSVFQDGGSQDGGLEQIIATTSHGSAIR